MKYLASFLLVTFIASGLTLAKDFSGSYSLTSDGDQMNLTLKRSNKNTFLGELTAEGSTLPIKGKVEKGMLIGTFGVNSEIMAFRANLKGNELVFTMFEAGQNDQPVTGSSETFRFQRVETESFTKTKHIKKKNSTGKAVVINGVNLSKEQIGGIQKKYGVKPLPGKYWYDSKSGLYGVIGNQAFGFMHPGHKWGKLRRDASKGNTGVMVNNRELSQTEWAIWSYILGYWIQVGSYWLDGKGNAGYVGNPTPVINLYRAAQQNAYGGRGGKGDNFWSTRFSAGNYDSDNQRGYVSVPGHGPVGYGF